MGVVAKSVIHVTKAPMEMSTGIPNVTSARGESPKNDVSDAVRLRILRCRPPLRFVVRRSSSKSAASSSPSTSSSLPSSSSSSDLNLVARFELCARLWRTLFMFML